MKRVLAVCLAALMLLSLVGCIGPEDPTPSTQPQLDDVTKPTKPTDPTQPSKPQATDPTAQPTQPTQPQPTEPLPTEPQPTDPQPTDPQPSQPIPEDPALPTDIEDDMLVMVGEYLPSIRQDLMYASDRNFTGKNIYHFTQAYLRFGTLKKLDAVNRELAQQGLGLLIWDGFRPLSAQAKLWEICPDSKFVSNPVTGNCNHCRGNAVDLTLVNLYTGEILEMPSGFDDFSDKGDRDYSDCSPNAAANAQLLQTVMEKHGFKGYQEEWWHYTDTVNYDKETWFDPGMGYFWYPTCNESLNVRSKASASASVVGQVYPDDQLILLGWSSGYAKIRCRGMEGYVRSTYVLPMEEDYFGKRLPTVEYTAVYTYEQMMTDLREMEDLYGDVAEVEIIGMSELGRELPVLRIGDENAQYHVLIHASIHGREHTTSWLVMAMADYWLNHGIAGYGDVCYHIVPMLNPDGVTISQTGKLNEQQMEIYRSDLANGYTNLGVTEYARQWKANGIGIDLNRNFDAGWAYIRHRKGPSSSLYAGTEPFSASEAAALRDYTQKYEFGVTISYHSMGSILYYEYGKNKEVNAQSKDLAQTVKSFTGYPLEGSTSVDAGGYKDWAIDKLGIPSLTVEIGTTSPVNPDREMHSIFARNYSLLPALALWLQGGV